MNGSTINELEKLKQGKSITLTNDCPKEIYDLVINLKNLGILQKSGRSGYSANFTSRKYLTKLIELNSWDTFLEWLDRQNVNGSVKNDFSGSTIGQVNLSDEKMDIKSPVTQNLHYSTTTDSKKKSGIEITALIIGIVAGIVAIYEFVIKQLIN